MCVCVSPEPGQSRALEGWILRHTAKLRDLSHSPLPNVPIPISNFPTEGGQKSQSGLLQIKNRPFPRCNSERKHKLDAAPDYFAFCGTFLLKTFFLTFHKSTVDTNPFINIIVQKQMAL